MNKNLIISVLVIGALIVAGIFLFQGQSGKQQLVGQKESDQTVSTGKILAGKSSLYQEFTKAEYEKALAAGKIVFLDFYANWCPVCRVEGLELKAGFDALTTDKVVGFRVNYNDPDTDPDEKALAKQFNIPYQHTKVILKNGKEVARSGDQWDREMFLKEINSVL